MTGAFMDVVVSFQRTSTEIRHKQLEIRFCTTFDTFMEACVPDQGADMNLRG